MKSTRRGLRAVIATLMTASAMGVGVSTAQPSWAASCSAAYHCYARTGYGAAAGGYAPTNASGADLEVDCLSVPSPSYTEFADWEVWQDADDNTGWGNYWVEEGMTAGAVDDGGTYHTGFEWFWADQRPNGGYNEHYIGGAQTRSWVNASFYWQGPSNAGSWAVYRGGSYVGTSTNLGPNGWGGDAGLEATTTSARAQADLDNYQYADPNWNWHPVPANYQPVGVDGFVTSWSNGDSGPGAWLYLTTGCGSAAAVATTAKALDAAGSYQGKPLSQSEAPAVLRGMAAWEAGRNGEAAPHGMTYVSGTRQQAAALMGTSVTGDDPSYIVELHGNFTGYHAHVPRNHKVPSGNTMLVVVSATTGKITDMGIVNSVPDLQTVGAPTAL